LRAYLSGPRPLANVFPSVHYSSSLSTRVCKLSILAVPVLLVPIHFWHSCGSLTDPDPALFDGGFQDANKKFFRLLLFEGTFTSVFKNKKTYRSHKTLPTYLEIKVFLPFLLNNGRIRIQIRIHTNNNGSGSGRHKSLRIRNHHTDFL
jgi:hypothetical protein